MINLNSINKKKRYPHLCMQVMTHFHLTSFRFSLRWSKLYVMCLYKFYNIDMFTRQRIYKPFMIHLNCSCFSCLYSTSIYMLSLFLVLLSLFLLFFVVRCSIFRFNCFKSTEKSTGSGDHHVWQIIEKEFLVWCLFDRPQSIAISILSNL